MENASKALMIAASVLLGIMIISVGTVLFQSFSDFSKDAVAKMEEKQITEWNNTYLKYYGSNTYYDKEKKKEITRPIQVTAHDIVSVINSAKQNNINYFEDEWPQNPNENIYYLQVAIPGKKNAERMTEEEKIKFLQENALTETHETKYFRCKDVKVSSSTKRVYFIEFEEYKTKS